MAFDPEELEELIALGKIARLQEVAWNALEVGLDGPAILSVASLNDSDGWELDRIFPKAMSEMGIQQLDTVVAARRWALRTAKRILLENDDPLKYVGEFQQLWIRSGYDSAHPLRRLGTLDDEVYLARQFGEDDDSIRTWVRKALQEVLIS